MKRRFGAHPLRSFAGALTVAPQEEFRCHHCDKPYPLRDPAGNLNLVACRMMGMNFGLTCKPCIELVQREACRLRGEKYTGYKREC